MWGSQQHKPVVLSKQRAIEDAAARLTAAAALAGEAGLRWPGLCWLAAAASGLAAVVSPHAGWLLVKQVN